MRQAVRAIVVKDGNLLVMHRNKFGLEYYALPGGAMDMGEEQLQTLHRELGEETSIQVANPRLVIIEDAGDMYGMQYIYLCDYAGGEPALMPESEEAKINALGSNLYEPRWLPLADLPQTNLLPKELKQAVIEGLAKGFPDTPLQLKIQD
jgi:ADP-ribose pyrophosphatase YjhB (NUDIX family)